MATAAIASPPPLLASRIASKSSPSVNFSSVIRLSRAVPGNALGLTPLPVSGRRCLVRRQAVSGGSDRAGAGSQEEVFFDGGPHYGDLLVNIVFGFSLVWLPLTLAAVFRNLFLRYRFTNLRVTILSGLTGDDRKDFGYDVIKDVQVVPRFIGEWGDVVFTLTDGTKIDLRCVPKFREVAKYCLDKAGERSVSQQTAATRTKGFAS